MLDFELGAKASLGRCKPSSIIACGGNVVYVEGGHGENGIGAEDVDAGVRDALLPFAIDKTGTKEHVELARGLFQAVEAEFEMTHPRRAIEKTEGLADVHVFLDGSVGERRVDIMLAKFEITCGRNGEEEAEACIAND
jgi:hypothetical protein